MTLIRSTRMLLASAALVTAALGIGGTAQARSDVYWSVGVGAPGAQVVLGNAPPIYVNPVPVYAPRPVYYSEPVYVQPRPVYYAPPVYVQPRPIYVQQAPVWERSGYYDDRHRHGNGHGRGHHRSKHRDHDRDRDHDR